MYQAIGAALKTFATQLVPGLTNAEVALRLDLQTEIEIKRSELRKRR
jgi:hypothetical protein